MKNLQMPNPNSVPRMWTVDMLIFSVNIFDIFKYPF